MPLPPRQLWTALLASAAVTASAGVAQAQSEPAGSTGIFLRAGATVSGFDLGAMTFRLQDRANAREAVPTFSGKQLELGRRWLGGGSIGAHVDGRRFFVRVGADLYANPAVAMEDFHVESTALGWIAAGPRFVFGSFTLLAGLRVGALVVDLTRVERRDEASGRREFRREYTGLGALYAVDLGAQWRPTRWLEVDLSVGQDVLGVMLATTASLSVSLGWTASPR